MAERPTVEHYFMDMTHLVKARGTCPRRQVGAVIVKDKRVLTTGYNGAPRNFPHPIDTGCLRDELQIPRGMMADVCPCLHAEQNAILQAATTGVSIEGAELYCTTQPCTQCSRMIANAGITRVCFQEEYPDPLAIGILTTARVELYMWDAVTNTAHVYGAKNTFEQAQDALRQKWAKEHPDWTPKSPLLVVNADGAPKAAPVGRAPTTPTTPTTTPAPAPATMPEVAPPAGQAEETEPEPTKTKLRDLRDDPAREELIRRLAQAKAKARKKAREEAGFE